MDNSYDLMRIYGIPPASYSEDDPNDLFLRNLPSLEQIASFNLALQPQSNRPTMGQGMGSNQGIAPVPDLSGNNMSTPTTTIGPMMNDSANDITSVLMPQSSMQSSASSELPSNLSPSGNQTGSLTQQITDFSNPYPVTAQSIQYLNGFIRTQIGRRAQIEFLMGNAELVTRDGYLLGVGANYILINEIGTNDITACDFYNIKFIRFLY